MKRREATTGRSMRGETLIFLHIPKAAGTTMRTIIERQYRRGEIYAIYEKTRAYHSMADFDRLTDQDKSKIRVYMGHISYGLHRRIAGRATYFALMRDPVDRVISYYHHVMSRGYRFKGSKISLLKFFSLKNRELDNYQTRILSGVAVPYGACTEEMLRTAIDNIEKNFVLVGLAERFDESLLMIAKHMGWTSLGYADEGGSKNRPSKEHFSRTELDMIRNRNRLDMILYAYAKRLFERKRQEAGVEMDQALLSLQQDKASFRRWRPGLAKSRHLRSWRTLAMWILERHRRS